MNYISNNKTPKINEIGISKTVDNEFAATISILFPQIYYI